MRHATGVSPNWILKRIVRDQLGDGKQYTYVIFGERGPTGKTWLCNELKNHGFNAIEITENMFFLVEYCDNDNHIIVDDLNKQMIIVLNRRLSKGE